MASAAPPPLSFTTKAFYGFGSISYGIKDGAFKSFLMIFYNQVIGVPASVVGTAVLVALLVDSLLDPILGQWSDNFRSRWGRRHPFMYASAIPAAGSFLLLWMPPEGLSDTQMFFYIVGVAVLVRSFITMYEIPSSALAPELSPHYDERTSIMAFRYFFGVAGGVILAIITFSVFLQPEPGYPVGQLNPNGWWRYAVMASIVMVLTILVSTAGTHSRIRYLRQPEVRDAKPLGQTLKEMGTTLNNKSFLSLMAYGLIKFTATGTTAALNLYFATYFWGLTSHQMSILLIDSLLAAAIALPLAPRLSKTFGKRPAAMALLLGTVAFGLIPYGLYFAGVMPPLGSTPLVLSLLFFQGFGSVCGITSMILVASMLADVVEDSEVRTGRRSEGLFFAANSLIQKAVSGVGLFVAGMLLASVGFPEGAKPGQVDRTIVEELVLVYVPTLIAIYTVGLLCLFGYKIDRSGHEENLRRLGTPLEPGGVQPIGAPAPATGSVPGGPHIQPAE